MRKNVVMILIILLASLLQAQTQFPRWATDQLELRRIVGESIRESQKWQRSDGSIYAYLNLYKWDDEVEIFYDWLPYYWLTGDPTVYASVRKIALAYINRAEMEGLFDHGYYRDAFYDTEHTIEGMIVLAGLVWANPQDIEIVAALEDVVEHAANMVVGYEPWFESTTSLMRSIRLGTRKVNKYSTTAIDWTFNLQFVKMALAAYYATGREDYLTWSKTYLDGWIRVLERNEVENLYYLAPSEVDPYSGRIGFLSGHWYQSAFEPGWGWPIKGNEANRDMRGAFLDAYRMTGERRFLEAIVKHVQTLFDNGTSFQPANYFDGIRWTPDDDKVTVNMSVQSDLLGDLENPKFTSFMKRWYEYQRYPDPEFHFWAFRKFGGMDKIDKINVRSLDNARKRLAELKEISALPEAPDDFIRIGGYWGLTLVPFGGIASLRGEMPWMDVVYFKPDGSVGLPHGVAALAESKDHESTQFQLCNTTNVQQTIFVQNGFMKEPIYRVLINGVLDTVMAGDRAQVTIPPLQTIQVCLESVIKDDPPPQPPTMLQLFVVHH